MPKSHRPYPPEYRERMIELVRSGRSPESLAKESSSRRRSAFGTGCARRIATPDGARMA